MSHVYGFGNGDSGYDRISGAFYVERRQKAQKEDAKTQAPKTSAAYEVCPPQRLNVWGQAWFVDK
jgi:hypothetical protein